MDDIRDEPALCGVTQSCAEAGSNGVWGEPALIDATAADAERRRHHAWLAEQWSRTSAMPRLIAAVAIHGVYNLGALIFAIFNR